MKTKLTMTPPLLRMILFWTIGLMILLSVVGLWFFHGQLTKFADEVNADNVAAASSEQDATKLGQLKAEMDKDPVAVTRASTIVADSKSYQYQNQIIDDLSAYASAAGFQINGFSFAASTTAGGTAAPASASTPITSAPTPAGLKTEVATITLPKSISYLAYMKFLKSIEENLTKMEITGVSVQLDPTTGLLTPNPLTIGVYVR